MTATLADGSTQGTWSGATWDELLNAYMHNVAGLQIQKGGSTAIYWLQAYSAFSGTEELVTILPIGGVIGLSPDGTFEVAPN